MKLNHVPNEVLAQICTSTDSVSIFLICFYTTKIHKHPRVNKTIKTMAIVPFGSILSHKNEKISFFFSIDFGFVLFTRVRSISMQDMH